MQHDGQMTWAEIRRENKRGLGSFSGEQLVAVLILDQRNRVSIIYVDPDHRGEKHTRALVERARAEIAPDVLTHDNHYSEAGATLIDRFQIPIGVDRDGETPPLTRLPAEIAEKQGRQALADWAEVLTPPSPQA
jgi:GNAT superfamily N-acetyltransferase